MTETDPPTKDGRSDPATADAGGPKDGPRVVTFGCRLNTFESEVMRDQAARAGLAPDAILVNTCAVTREAERQARQAIRRLRRENPGARLIVTGCGAQIDPAAWAAMPEVDQVLGNREKLEAESYRAPPPLAPIQVTDTAALTETVPHLITGLTERTRAFLQVQQGCDHRCTFCVIPLARGDSRSVPVDRILEQVRLLVDSGTREIVMTGVDIAAYGRDLPRPLGLGALVRAVLEAAPDLARLRLSSLDPVVVREDAALLDLVATEPRLLPHLHLSVQAGSDLILKRMKRRHSRADILTLARDLRDRRPGLALGADLIAGFPTETEVDAQATRDLVDEAGLSHLHVFPYSPRPGTPAARMPQVERATIKARAQALRDTGEAALARFAQSRVGQVERVLVETPGLGHGETYLPVRLDPAHPPGHIVAVRLAGTGAPPLIGEAIP